MFVGEAPFPRKGASGFDPIDLTSCPTKPKRNVVIGWSSPRSSYIWSNASLKRAFMELPEYMNIHATLYLAIVAQTIGASLWGSDIPSISCGSNVRIDISIGAS